ncbi:MAG TPA: HepT-like ribonuclease domain-containing protein [Stellaceae bacterium]|nr:HepT-like ribonuclease domain-containing protein [Stellaceae bacterium]
MRSDREQSALIDIRHNIALAQDFVRDLTFESFRDDLMRVYAVTRCLEIISEASRRVTDTLKQRHPDIAWRDMAGAGNIYRHDYEDVAAQDVWNTVQLALPRLRAVVESELATP